MMIIGTIAAMLVVVAPPLWPLTVPLALLFCPRYFGRDTRSLYELLRSKP